MAYTPQIYYPQSAYGPQYQQNYQPQIQQPQMVGTQMSSPQQNNQGLIWVQGETGAKSYLVAPNSTVLLMDSEDEVFYIKMTDGAGMPTLRTFSYKEQVQNAPRNNAEQPQTNSKSLSEQFVTKEEYKALLSQYEELKQRVAELQKPKTTTRKKEVNPDE